jgi:hypothetical protein
MLKDFVGSAGRQAILSISTRFVYTVKGGGVMRAITRTCGIPRKKRWKMEKSKVDGKAKVYILLCLL